MAPRKAILHIACVAGANPIPYTLPLLTPGGGGGGGTSFTHIEHRAGYGRGNKITSRSKFLTILATNEFYIITVKDYNYYYINKQVLSSSTETAAE